MKKFIFITLMIGLFSCNGSNFKYKIEGSVRMKGKSGQDSTHAAIAYTDTIYGFDDDSIWYYNSDGSKLTILAPYKVYSLKK